MPGMKMKWAIQNCLGCGPLLITVSGGHNVHHQENPEKAWGVLESPRRSSVRDSKMIYHVSTPVARSLGKFMRWRAHRRDQRSLLHTVLWIISYKFKFSRNLHIRQGQAELWSQTGLGSRFYPYLVDWRLCKVMWASHLIFTTSNYISIIWLWKDCVKSAGYRAYTQQLP